MPPSAQDVVQISVLEEEMNDTKARITLLRQQMDFLMEDHSKLRIEVRDVAAKAPRGPRRSQSNLGASVAVSTAKVTFAGSPAGADAGGAAGEVGAGGGAGVAAATAGPPDVPSTAPVAAEGGGPSAAPASASAAISGLDASMSTFMHQHSAAGAAGSPGAPATPGVDTSISGVPEESGGTVSFAVVEGGVLEKSQSEEAHERLEEEMAKVRSQMDKFGLTRAAWKDDKTEALTKALQTWRGPKWLLLWLLTTHAFQVFSFFAVLLHIFSMILEVDLQDGTPGHTQAVMVLYGCTTYFLVETSLRLTIIPQCWKSKTELLDFVVCTIVFALETMSFFEDNLAADVKWVLAVRFMRLVRFLWKLREHDSFRPVRIILVAISGTAWTLVWVTVMLFVVFFTFALVLRTFTKSGAGGAGTDDDALSELLTDRFATVPQIMLTLLEVFLNAFDYSAVITRPLLGSREFAMVGVFFVVYQMFMQLCLVNFVTGVFVEQIGKDALKSDKSLERKAFVQKDISFGVLAETFQKIDRKGEGVISVDDLNVALVESPEIEQILRVKESCSGAGTPESWFAELDDTGEGTGELSFTDFVFGTVKHRMKSDSFEQLIFDHQMTKFVKSSAQTGKSVADLDSFVHNHAGQVDRISSMLQQQKGRHTGELKNVRSRLNALQLKIESLAVGLNIPTGAAIGAMSGEAKNLPNIKHVREAGEISVLMGSLKEQVQRATEAASTHNVSTSQILDEAIARFRKELKQEVQSQLMVLSAGSAQVASDAVAAARVLKAATVAVSNPAMGSRRNSALSDVAPSGSALSTFRSQGGDTNETPR